MISFRFFLLLIFISGPIALFGQSSQLSFDKYYNYKEQLDIQNQLNKKFPKKTKVHELSLTPGKRKVTLFEIGNEVSLNKKNNPAIFVIANLEGNTPISSAAALFLIQDLLADSKHYADLNWYIVPNANPDAYHNFFAKIKYKDSRNDAKHNDDMDDQTDDDRFVDLNEDGNYSFSGVGLKSKIDESI